MLGNAAELAEAVDIFGDCTRRIIDLFLRVEPADAKPQAGTSQVFAKSQGPQDVAGLGVDAGAGAAAGNGDGLHADHQRFTVYEWKRAVKVAGKAGRFQVERRPV